MISTGISERTRNPDKNVLQFNIEKEIIMKIKIIYLLLLILLLTGCGRVSDSQDEVYFSRFGKVYKLEDKVMYSVADLTDPEFISGNVLDTDQTIYDAIDVSVRVKILTSAVLYQMELSPSKAASGDMTYTESLVRRSYNTGNILTIKLLDIDGFVLESIEVDLSGDRTGLNASSGDEVVGYLFEGSINIGMEVAQNIKYVAVRWRIEKP